MSPKQGAQFYGMGTKRKSNLRVIDFFCGAGGFSEGFRQQGFSIIKGVDFWQPAIDTHNLNHGLDDSVKNILDFWGTDSSDVEEIESLEDTEFLVGSPSCVSFSLSNRAGKADKTEGVRLIEAYLRVIAVKKHKPHSILKAWYMENVPRSRDFIREQYTFEQLNLAEWAEQNHIKMNIALNVKGAILNAGDYGAPQERKRFIAGEWIETGEFIKPRPTHKVHKTVADIRGNMPSTNEMSNTKKKFTDPNYPSIKLGVHQITDHFYDTGVYEIEWEKSVFLKTNHPFMGPMAFPEDENRTSRTIMATRLAGARESILYKSEHKHKGDGEYRLPTIRELASLMGFPYLYQFVGSEATKWKQIGNSVCPHQSAALAKALRENMSLKPVWPSKVSFASLKNNSDAIENLNTFKRKDFSLPKRRSQNAKFRRHILKMGNMTVDLMNYHPSGKGAVARDWHVVAFLGIGQGYGVKIFSPSDKTPIEQSLRSSRIPFDEYKMKVESLPVNLSKMQQIYEEDLHIEQNSNPILLLKSLGDIITSYECHRDVINEDIFPQKSNVPLAQLMSAYGLLSILNNPTEGNHE